MTGAGAPVVLLAFANDWRDDGRPLRSLLDESNAISRALVPLVEAGALAVPAAIHNATVDAVIHPFREGPYRDRICLFHFGGHADGKSLQFEDPDGAPAAAHAGGLAGYLGQQRDLVLVFLNGCGTEPQVRALRNAGVKAVVATTTSVLDTVAAEFARAFYTELATRPLAEAFERAVLAVRTERGDDPQAVRRDVVSLDAPTTPAWPWLLDCDAAYRRWRLGRPVPRPRRWPWIAAAVLAVSAASAAAVWARSRAPGDRLAVSSRLASVTADGGDDCPFGKLQVFEVVARNPLERTVTASLQIMPYPSEVIFIRHDGAVTGGKRSPKPVTIKSAYDDEQYVVGLNVFLSEMPAGATDTETVTVCEKDLVKLEVTSRILQ